MSETITTFLAKLRAFKEEKLMEHVKKKRKLIMLDDSAQQFKSPYRTDKTPEQPEYQKCLQCGHSYVNQNFTNEEIKSKTNEMENIFRQKLAEHEKNPNLPKPRRTNFKFDIMCYCCTVNCLFSNEENTQTEKMVADFFSKPLQGKLFEEFRDIIINTKLS